MEFFFLVKDIWEVGGKCGRRVKSWLTVCFGRERAGWDFRREVRTIAE